MHIYNATRRRETTRRPDADDIMDDSSRRFKLKNVMTIGVDYSANSC